MKQSKTEENKKRLTSPTQFTHTGNKKKPNLHSYMLLPGTAWSYWNTINEVSAGTILFAEDDAVFCAGD